MSIASCTRLIKEKSILRSIIRQSESFIKQAKAQEFESLEMFLDQMEAEVFKISQNQSEQNLFPINQLVSRGLEHLESLHGKNLNITGLSTSFEELDSLTSGLQPGDLSIVAA